ncbi:MAG: serine/threonine-protein kinase [Myxococcota bacterium]
MARVEPPSRASGESAEEATVPAVLREFGDGKPDAATRAVALGRVKEGLFNKPQRVRQLDRYVLLRKLGEGGMGTVWSAFDPTLERRVAIKVLRSDVRSAGTTPQLLREARAAAKLQHANVVAIHDVGSSAEGESSQEELFVVMELVSGMTLRQWQDGKTQRAVLNAYVQVARGLAAAHAAGLVHRDFKPANAMVDDAGVVRVLDFGLAHVATTEGADGTNPGDEASLLRFAGTPKYMAPEQHNGTTADARADVFAFSASLFEALTGCPAFAGPTLADYGLQKQTGQIASPPAGVLGSRLHRLLRRGLAADPDERPQTMDEVIAALTRARRRPATVALGAATVGLIAVGLMQGRGPDVCQRRASTMSAFWAVTTKEAVAAALKDDAPAGTPSRITRALDAYVERWAELHRGACSPGAIEDPETFGTAHAQVRCLEERLHTAEAMVGRLRTGEVAGTEALPAVANLEPLPPCLVAAASDEPVPAEARAEVEAIHAAVAALRADHLSGAYAAAAEKAEALRGRAAATEHDPTIARTELSRADAYAELGQTDVAVAAATEALLRATAGGDHDLAARATIALARYEGAMKSRHADGTRWAALSRAHIGQLGERPELEYRILSVQGLIRTDVRDFAGARAAYEAALQSLANQERDGTLAAAHTQNALGSVIAELGDLETAGAAFEESLAIMEDVLGSEHPDLAYPMANLAVAAALRGDVGAGVELIERALALTERWVSEDHPAYATHLDNVAVFYAKTGNRTHALELERRVLALHEANGRGSGTAALRTRLNLASDLHALERFDESLLAYTSALAQAEALHGPDHERTLRVWALLADTAQAAARPDVAAAAVARVLAGEPWRLDDLVPLRRRIETLADLVAELGDAACADDLRALVPGPAAGDLDVAAASLRFRNRVALPAADGTLPQLTRCL